MSFYKSCWLMMIFTVFGGGFLFSETVSVMVVETGVSLDAPVRESSIAWENGLMDAFFEYGHIVSNAAMLRLNAEQADPYPNEELLNIDAVREGGAAFYVLAVLRYDEGDEAKLIPSLVSLRLVGLYPDRVLYELQVDGNNIHSRNETEQARRAARAMIPYLKK